MESLIEPIRVAVLPDATDEQKHEGALACRAILAALEAKQGEPMQAPAAPTTSPPIALPDIGPLVQAIRAMGPDQLLDIAIKKLRESLPAGTTVRSLEPVRFAIVPVPPTTR